MGSSLQSQCRASEQKGSWKSFPSALCLFLLGGDCGFGGLEADFGMGSVAERLIDGGSAATETYGGLAAEVDYFAIDIDQSDGPLDNKGAVGLGANRDCGIGHSDEAPGRLRTCFNFEFIKD
jgi:hypothetical protein